MPVGIGFYLLSANRIWPVSDIQKCSHVGILLMHIVDKIIDFFTGGRLEVLIGNTGNHHVTECIPCKNKRREGEQHEKGKQPEKMFHLNIFPDWKLHGT